MGSYDCKKRASRLVEDVKMGIIQPFMMSGIINMDSSVPEYAREEVIRLANEMLKE